MKYGTVLIESSEGTKELEIKDYVTASLKDQRISIAGIEGGTIVINITLPQKSSGNMYAGLNLTKKSLAGVMALLSIYCDLKGWNFECMLEEVFSGEAVEYSYSDNLEKK